MFKETFKLNNFRFFNLNLCDDNVMNFFIDLLRDKKVVMYLDAPWGDANFNFWKSYAKKKDGIDFNGNHTKLYQNLINIIKNVKPTMCLMLCGISNHEFVKNMLMENNLKINHIIYWMYKKKYTEFMYDLGKIPFDFGENYKEEKYYVDRLIDKAIENKIDGICDLVVGKGIIITKKISNFKFGIFNDISLSRLSYSFNKLKKYIK